MENITDKIGAAKAKLAYQKMMVETGRAGVGALKKALAEWKELESAHSKVPRVGVKMEKVIAEPVEVLDYEATVDTLQKDERDPYLAAKADLLVEIRRLTDLEAEKSNALALAPIDSPQPFLCGELVEGRKRIEGYWDQYYELERTGQLPAPPVPTRPLTGDEVADKELKLGRIARDIDSAVNIRQKARKALREAASNTIDKEKFQLNVEKYTAKIAGCDAEIDRLNKDRNILLGR